MKRFLAIFCAFILCGTTVQAEDIEEPKDLYAQAAVLMDAESGRILFAKNGDEILANASTTKIMTCILALEEGNMESVVTVSSGAVAQPKVHLGMQIGEQFVLRDLLYSLMLESHNDSAVAIAEGVAGSVEAFADKMNAKAKEIGCENTYFITPNGLDATDDIGMHATTAADLARIMSYCITDSPKKEEFLEITATPSYSFSNVENSRNFSCSNHNSFLTMMEGAISGKTGFTGKAGYCYVGALERDGRTFVVSLLACGWPNNKNYKWKDTTKLMEYALENYEYRNVYEEPIFPELKVEDGVADSGNMFEDAYLQLKVDTHENTDLQVLLRTDETVEIEYHLPEQLEAPISEGEEVGSISYYLNGEKIKEYAVVAGESIRKKDLSWYFRCIANVYFGMTGIKRAID